MGEVPKGQYSCCHIRSLLYPWTRIRYILWLFVYLIRGFTNFISTTFSTVKYLVTWGLKHCVESCPAFLTTPFFSTHSLLVGNGRNVSYIRIHTLHFCLSFEFLFVVIYWLTYYRGKLMSAKLEYNCTNQQTVLACFYLSLCLPPSVFLSLAVGAGV